jgi:hypothetical protein
MREARNGSSDAHSKLRPPIGVRWRFTVGASSTPAPLLRVSSASAAPIRSTSAGSNDAPCAAPHGKHADVGPPRNRVPRAPFGPSVTRSAGIPSRGTPAVCHRSTPATSAHFSSSESSPSHSAIRASTQDLLRPGTARV